jgi:DNA-binding NarL/FixJ family response regulator
MKKILIIEDDTVLRENTAVFIKGENFEVFVAADGLEGVQQTLQHLPDLILCDISMPNMNGLDFYKTIKQIKATATIPLVFFSARTENEDIRAGMQLGADDYIIKPFDFYEVLKVIKTRLVKHEKIVQFNDEKFYAVIKHPTLGMFIYQNERFLYYNETLATIFGYTKQAFSILTFKDLIDEDTASKLKILNAIDRCLRDINSTISLKFFANHQTNGKIQVELFGTVITYKGVASIVGNVISLNYNQKFEIVNATGTFDFKLSKREIEVLELITEGKSTHQIAELLFLSERTIETYRAKLLSKTSSKNSAELIMFAIKNKLVSLNQ